MSSSNKKHVMQSLALSHCFCDLTSICTSHETQPTLLKTSPRNVCGLMKKNSFIVAIITSCVITWRQGGSNFFSPQILNLIQNSRPLISPCMIILFCQLAGLSVTNNNHWFVISKKKEHRKREKEKIKLMLYWILCVVFNIFAKELKNLNLKVLQQEFQFVFLISWIKGNPAEGGWGKRYIHHQPHNLPKLSVALKDYEFLWIGLTGAWYCIRIRTRGGIYDEIWPEKGTPEGSGHVSSYIPTWVLIRTLSHSYQWLCSSSNCSSKMFSSNIFTIKIVLQLTFNPLSCLNIIITKFLTMP